MKEKLNEISESPIYSATPVEDNKKLYELTVRMQQLAINVKRKHYDFAGDSDELADTVLEFLKVSGWSR